MITLNGEPVDFAGTLEDLVRQRAGVRDGIAVAVDHAVVPRSGWGACWVGTGERIEIVTAVQGG